MDIQKIKTGIKRFFSNPNTLTFLLVIVLIVIIYVVYTYMINRAIAPVNIPYCTKKLGSMTEITDDYISQVKISGGFVSANGSTLIQTSRNVKGKYVAPGYFIPENSFFYRDAIADESIATKTPYSDIGDNDTAYLYKTDFHNTYGCSIMSGNYIDLYVKTQDEDGNLIFTKYITSIKVNRVIDKQGRDVFTETDVEEPKPAAIEFILPKSYVEVLKKLENTKKLNAELIIVPRNAGFTENPEETKFTDIGNELNGGYFANSWSTISGDVQTVN